MKPSATTKVGRNDPCPCGSGTKYKKCPCGAYEATQFPRAKAGDKEWAEVRHRQRRPSPAMAVISIAAALGAGAVR